MKQITQNILTSVSIWKFVFLMFFSPLLIWHCICITHVNKNERENRYVVYFLIVPVSQCDIHMQIGWGRRQRWTAWYSWWCASDVWWQLSGDGHDTTGLIALFVSTLFLYQSVNCLLILYYKKRNVVGRNQWQSRRPVSKQADRFQGVARRTRCVVSDTDIWYAIRMQHHGSDIWLKQQLRPMTIWATPDKEHMHLGQLD